SLAVVLHTPGDFGLNHYLRSGGVPRPASLKAVLAAVAPADDDASATRSDGGTGAPSSAGAPTRAEVAERAGLTARTCARVLGVLLSEGAVREVDGGFVRTDDRSPATVVRAVREGHERRAVVDRSRVEMVRTYAETDDCRRRLLLELLGE